MYIYVYMYICLYVYIVRARARACVCVCVCVCLCVSACVAVCRMRSSGWHGVLVGRASWCARSHTGAQEGALPCLRSEQQHRHEHERVGQVDPRARRDLDRVGHAGRAHALERDRHPREVRVGDDRVPPARHGACTLALPARSCAIARARTHFIRHARAHARAHARTHARTHARVRANSPDRG